jgi:hypothetical protein
MTAGPSLTVQSGFASTRAMAVKVPASSTHVAPFFNPCMMFSFFRQSGR